MLDSLDSTTNFVESEHEVNLQSNHKENSQIINWETNNTNMTNVELQNSMDTMYFANDNINNENGKINDEVNKKGILYKADNDNSTNAKKIIAKRQLLKIMPSTNNQEDQQVQHMEREKASQSTRKRSITDTKKERNNIKRKVDKQETEGKAKQPIE